MKCWTLLIASCCAYQEQWESGDLVKCNGAWSNNDISGSFNSSISLYFSQFQTNLEFFTAALLIANVQDLNQSLDNLQVCTSDSLLCTNDQLGQFILNTTSFNKRIDLQTNKSSQIDYQVETTGFYCIALFPKDNVKFELTVKYVNPYGYLSAADYPKLTFYFVMTLIYLFIAILWFLQAAKYWKDLLPIQNYLSGIVLFLLFEQSMNYAYFEYLNRFDFNSLWMMILVCILSATRNSASFFILLIVGLGYGVVKPSLGMLMKRCQLLALIHFVFGLVYSLGSIHVIHDTWLLLFIFPLSVSMTIFYYWTLYALENTMKDLAQRRQQVKLDMYTRLFRILILSISLLFICFLVNSFYFYYRMDYLAFYWRIRWMLLDGWLNLLYLIIFLSIVFLWKPTANNQRYGLSEVAQDDFEDVIDDQELQELQDLKIEEDELMEWAERHVGENH